MYMFNIFLLNVNLFCIIRQFPLSFTNFLFSIYSSLGVNLLLFISEGLITSSDNPLNFHDEMLLVLHFFKKFAIRLEK